MSVILSTGAHTRARNAQTPWESNLEHGLTSNAAGLLSRSRAGRHSQSTPHKSWFGRAAAYLQLEAVVHHQRRWRTSQLPQRGLCALPGKHHRFCPGHRLQLVPRHAAEARKRRNVILRNYACSLLPAGRRAASFLSAGENLS